MALNIQLLFGAPQQPISTILHDRLDRCISARIAVGFMTIEGLKSIGEPLRTQPQKLSSLVVGAATFRAFAALDDLLESGVNAGGLYVHLGFSRPTGPGATHRFYRYHPMLHSKIYLLEMPEGAFCAFVGSHNMTGFALSGLNGEASVLIEGDKSEPIFSDLSNHIDSSRAQSVQYDPTLKEAYSWWTTQAFEGMRDKTRDIPRDAEPKRTIVVIATAASTTPREGQIIYFEIPEALGSIQSLRADVHVYLFDVLPSSPAEALAALPQATASFWCRTEGLEMGRGGVELRADWSIVNRRQPQLKRVRPPFRPAPSPGMQQVRVQVRGNVYGKFDYLFDSDKPNWTPIFDEEDTIIADEPERRLFSDLKLMPNPEDYQWLRVRGFERGEPSGSAEYRAALTQSAPESGSYILMSLRRRGRT